MKREGLYLGIDVGSVSAKVAVIDGDRKVLYREYSRTQGQPLPVALDMLKKAKDRFSEGFKSVSVTGSAGKLISTLIDAHFENEIVAHGTAVLSFHPDIRTVIEIGGEDSKLILLEPGPDGKGSIRDFSMNTVCAAGTGAFLDQQAARLGLSIEEFSALALKSVNPPRIAGRCSVFAKSDMIHLQQTGVPDYDIVAGLCLALARNFKATIGKGRDFRTPVAFQGGVAANAGMRKAFREVIGCGDEDMVVPEHYNVMGAIGAALHAMGKGGRLELDRLEGFISSQRQENKGLEPLSRRNRERKVGEKVDVIGKRLYLGVDIGSISTNIVALTEGGKTAARRYIHTAGRPLHAVSNGLRDIRHELEGAEIAGVGITGSGRYMIGEVIGADLVKDEITAQAAAAAHIEPEVDTVIEIGGQDAKYIRIKKGAVIDFEMNKACAAGTGSFLEEQAERLGLSIKEDFGRLALESRNPAPLGEKCTVFMESDLVHHQQRGARKDELVAGLSYSIVHNYTNKVAHGKPMGEKILFLGGVAANQGVVAAFERVLGKEVFVPEDHDVTGAIGAALLVMRERVESTRFKGFDVNPERVNVEGFQCLDCANRCEVKKLNTESGAVFFGGRCGKYDRKKKNSGLPDLFDERGRLLMSLPETEESLPKDAPKVGIPMALAFHEIIPFWRGFFSSLGIRVVLSKTGKNVIQKGIEAVVAETCFPVKVAHGHVMELLSKGVDFVFLPSILDLPDSGGKCCCPYIQALPYTIQSALDIKGVRVLSPVLRHNMGEKTVEKALKGMAKKAGIMGDIGSAIRSGMEAQNSFHDALKKRGEEALKGMRDNEKGVVIIGRPYNTCDSALNMDLPSSLRDKGVTAIPMDMLPLRDMDVSDIWGDMYWRCGQKILSAARFIRNDDRLHAIYVTNFGCGPDSFISRYFEEEMKGKPYLQIEIDEHSADAGAVTRCEAFVESLRNIESPREGVPEKARGVLKDRVKKGRRVFLPPMSDHIKAISSALQFFGVDSEVLPMHDQESLELGKRHSTGKECYPYVLTTGEMLKALKYNGRDIAFLMPTTTGPCRFGQYWRLQRIILDSLGYDDVPIYAPDQENDIYKGLGLDARFTRLAWHGILAVDIIDKRLRRVRPFEKVKGDADEAYRRYLKKVCDDIRSGVDVKETVAEAMKTFDGIDRHKERRPVLGIIGEIYVRYNPFGNEDIVRKIESLGGEVRLPPFAEWFLYLNHWNRREKWLRRDFRGFAGVATTELVQRWDHFRMGGTDEPSISEILHMASPYIDSSLGGEAVLSVGKAVDFARKGAAGVINVMPFNCMPGTIVAATLRRLQKENGDIPYLSVSYEGLKETNTHTRLEAFMHQARSYHEKRVSV